MTHDFTKLDPKIKRQILAEMSHREVWLLLWRIIVRKFSN